MYKANRKQIASDRNQFFLTVITLNVNGFNFPIRRQRLPEWIKTHVVTIFHL